MDCSPPGSSVHGIFQARILERVAISYSRGSSSDPGIEAEALGSPALQEDSLPAEPPGKSPNIGLSAWIQVLWNQKDETSAAPSPAKGWKASRGLRKET